MKKKITLLFCFLWGLAMFAQQEKNINYDFENQRSRMFSNLEKERVPHGILLDYAYDFTNVEIFNGTHTDSLFMTAYDVRAVYQTLITGVVADTDLPLMHPRDFSTQWTTTDRATKTIILGGLYAEYAKFDDENPKIQELISITNDKIEDKYIRGVWQNPYVTSQAFVYPVLVYRPIR